jgi:alpha-1,3-rhamnosyl/mannosyltransferase
MGTTRHEDLFMKVVIGTDSLQGSLTGVGRYTYELCKRLIHASAIDELEGFDFGRFHSIPARLQKLDGEFTSENKARVDSVSSQLREKLSRSRIATSIYEHYATAVSGLILKRRPGAIFHSPNFHLPKYTRKSVVTVHDLSYLLFPEYHPGARVAWMTKLVPKAVQDSSHIICVSESTKSALTEHYQVDPNKVTVTYLGVDDTFHVREAESVFQIMDAYSLSFGQYLLCVSTLEPRKNIEGLIDAFLRLSKETRLRHPLVLVGGFGWHCEQLELRISALVNEGVIHLGFVPNDELPFLYSGARCFIYPSFYEGFGLPVVEAQASGIPVIASNTSSLPEVVSEAAILIDPYDGDELFNAISRALEDQSWRESCSLAGLQKAREFRWDKCVQETIQVYQKIECL